MGVLAAAALVRARARAMLYAVDDMRYVLKVNPELYYEAREFITHVWYGRTYQVRQTDAQHNSMYQGNRLCLPLQ